MTDSFVYILRMKSPVGEIKIGTSRDVRNRVNSLQTGCPYNLEILATRPGGVREEAELHRRFRHARLRGEWYLPDSGLLEYVTDLPDVLPSYEGPLPAHARTQQALAYARHVQRTDFEQRTAEHKLENDRRYQEWLADQEATS